MIGSSVGVFYYDGLTLNIKCIRLSGRASVWNVTRAFTFELRNVREEHQATAG